MRTSRRCGAHLGDPPNLFSLHEFGFDFSKVGSKEQGEIWFSQPYLIANFKFHGGFLRIVFVRLVCTHHAVVLQQ